MKKFLSLLSGIFLFCGIAYPQNPWEWDNSGNIKTPSGFTGSIITNGSLLFPSVGYGIYQTQPDSSVGRNVLYFDAPTINGVIDPLFRLGYNYDGAKANHPKFYLALEGYYYDNTNYISEFYIDRYDTDTTHVRPWIIGCYDGYTSGAIAADFFTIGNRAGTAMLSFTDATHILLVDDAVTLILGGNNKYIKAETTTPGSYVGMIKVNAANEVELPESGWLRTPLGINLGASPNDVRLTVFSTNIAYLGVSAADVSGTTVVLMGPRSTGTGKNGGIFALSGGYSDDYLNNGDLFLQPYAGYVKFGTYVAKGAEIFAGYITIKDKNGTLKKVMICE